MWSRTNVGIVLLRRHDGYHHQHHHLFTLCGVSGQIRAPRTLSSSSVTRPINHKINSPRPLDRHNSRHLDNDKVTRSHLSTQRSLKTSNVYRQGENQIRERGKHSTPLSSPKSMPRSLRFRDERLPCREHLDPEGLILPTSKWIQITGTLPVTSLRDLVSAVEGMLQKEADETGGIVDLDALWNPLQDEGVPTYRVGGVLGDDIDQGDDEFIEIDNNLDEAGSQRTPLRRPRTNPPLFQVHAAHVILSPFGRPNGWKVQLANPSMVNAILTRASTLERSGRGGMKVGWKLVQVEEFHPCSSGASVDEIAGLDADVKAGNNGSSYSRTDQGYGVADVDVDDSMVRFENCPDSLDKEHLRYLLSQYDLASSGDTILRWSGKTNDGRKPHLTYVVRFASPAWARAAVRELQALRLDGKIIKLAQYPNQMRAKQNITKEI